MIADRLVAAIESGTVLPGDAVLYRYTRLGPVQLGIASVQKRALADLGGCVSSAGPVEYPRGQEDTESRALPAGQVSPPLSSSLFSLPSPARRDLPSDPSLFTHAGMVFDATHTVEMTSPRARLYPWERRLQGVAEIAVVRPAGNPDPVLLRQAAAEGYKDVLRGVRYPYSEIGVYWLWSWGLQKLAFGRKFSAVFRSRKRNVCSGSVIDWWQRAGITLGLEGLDVWPEAWYPARMLAPGHAQSQSRLDIILRVDRGSD